MKTLNRVNRIKEVVATAFVAGLVALLIGSIVYSERALPDTAYQQNRQAERHDASADDEIVVAPAGEARTGADIDGETVQAVRQATYQLYVRVSPPGRVQTQTFAFCTASFYARDDDEQGRPPGVYGTTAGHCLDLYSIIRERLNDRQWGAQFDLAVATDKSRTRFVTVESVDHGIKQWRRWRTADDDDRDRLRPETDDVDDWGVIRAPAGADLDVLPGTAEPGGLARGEPVWTAGHAWALGKTWMNGAATPDYRLPGTLYDHYTAVDVAAGPGMSGAAVVDSSGQQVGVLVAGFAGSDVTLVTPVQRIDFVRADDSTAGQSDYRNRWGYVYESRTEAAPVSPVSAVDDLTAGLPAVELPVDAARLYNRVRHALGGTASPPRDADNDD